MNKLMGFYELRHMDVPTVPWEEYTQKTQLDSGRLWTIRTAVYEGEDLHLPRLVGANGREAKTFAESVRKELAGKGVVIYYPYFIADKSGTLHVFQDRIVIEAVKDDLWNLVTYSERNVTIQIEEGNVQCNGDPYFLHKKEFEDIMKHVPKIKNAFKDILIQGDSVLLEWSFAYPCDIHKNRAGDKFLVFYEAREL